MWPRVRWTRRSPGGRGNDSTWNARNLPVVGGAHDLQNKMGCQYESSISWRSVPAALALLTKFGFMLHLDVAYDALSVLGAVAGGDGSHRPVEASLRCATAALSLARGPGREMGADLAPAINALWNIIPRAVIAGTSLHGVVVQAVEQACLKGARMPSTELAGFVQRLLAAALAGTDESALALISACFPQRV